MFTPLINAQPQLRTLVDLVMVNGYIIEHSNRFHTPSQNEVNKLEALISTLGSQQTTPMPMRSTCRGFRTAYEPLARVHMLW